MKMLSCGKAMRVRVDLRLRPAWSIPVRLTTWGVLVVACGLAACSLIARPRPSGAERFTPPAVYARWWAMTEGCSKRTGDLGAIEWYSVPGSQFTHDGQLVSGYANRYTNRIVLAGASTEQGPAVRHEMLHILLRADGHARAQFLGACASVVRCQGICVTDAGSWQRPQEDYVVLPPNSLDVTSSSKLYPLESDGQRWLSLKVTVRNPRGRALVVAAPGDPTTPPTFGYDLRGPSGGISGGEIATDSSTLFFQAFETKKWLFEFRIPSGLSGYNISPGNYLMRGGYARRWAAYDTIVVTP